MTRQMLGEIELNRIYQRDCIEGMRLLPDNSVDLVVTDPPYGINYYSNWSKSDEYRQKVKAVNGIQNDKDNTDFLSDVLQETYRTMKEDSHLYWFTRWDKIHEQLPIISQNFKVKNTLIWMKNNWSMGDLTGAYAGQYECIIFAQKGRRKLNEVGGRKRHTDILQYDRIPANKLRHSHEKPEDLISFLIRKSSNEGETVLDPFAGSGTTAVCARKTGRNFVSFELDAEYVQIANKRLESVEDVNYGLAKYAAPQTEEEGD